MGGFDGPRSRRLWSLMDTSDFLSTFLLLRETRHQNLQQVASAFQRRVCNTCRCKERRLSCRTLTGRPLGPRNYPTYYIPPRKIINKLQAYQKRQFHDYFVTHLPSSSLHPDSRSPTGPHHKLPRAASTPHTPGSGPSPAAAPPMVGPSRELTVVRIPIRSAKHHFGVSVSRGTRPYNEDTYQAGTIEIPAFAKRAPVSLSRSANAAAINGATSAGSASGDPQVFYFGVFDGHGGHECSDFLKEELHQYIEATSAEFELGSSLSRSAITKVPGSQAEESKANNSSKEGGSASDMSLEGQRAQSTINELDQSRDGKLAKGSAVPGVKGVESERPVANKQRAIELEISLVRQWKDLVGGYFRRFRPESFSIPSRSSFSEPRGNDSSAEVSKPDLPVSIETILMYAFLRADLDFVTAQASKPDPDSTSDLPLNNDEVLGEPSRQVHQGRIGGPTRFKGGSTASVAIISTPTPTPFWHPASPSSMVIAHVGDTRILLCETSTGLAIPVTTNHHPSSPVESTRLRRYAATFVTDSFGEERMSGLANTRAFGDMRSKRIGVSAEPELRRYELGPAQYSFLVLVSDGVSGTLSDQEIVDVVKEAKTPEQGARDVVGYSTEVSRDGDNTTCLVVRLGGWERRGEGGMGSLGTKEVRDFRRQDATDPRRSRT